MLVGGTRAHLFPVSLPPWCQMGCVHLPQVFRTLGHRHVRGCHAEARQRLSFFPWNDLSSLQGRAAVGVIGRAVSVCDLDRHKRSYLGSQPSPFPSFWLLLQTQTLPSVHKRSHFWDNAWSARCRRLPFYYCGHPPFPSVFEIRLKEGYSHRDFSQGHFKSTWQSAPTSSFD